MPRIRSIKPEFWDDEKLSGLSYQSRLLFIAIWNFADDLGTVRGNPVWLKNKIFPFDDTLRLVEFSKWLDALTKARFLVPIAYKGESYLSIRSFKAHQKIDKPSKSVNIPESELYKILDEHSANSRGGLDEGSLWEGKGEEGSRKGVGEEEDSTPPPRTGAVLFKNSDVFDFTVFRQKLEEWPEEKCKHYFDSANDYSESKGKKYINWIAAVRGWDRKEPWENRKKGAQNGSSHRNYRQAKEHPEQLTLR
jgi:hypothetical protein